MLLISKYNDLQNQAIQKLKIEEYETALEIFEFCLEENPDDIVNYIYIGIVNLLLGDEESCDLAWMSILLNDDPKQLEILSQQLLKIADRQASFFLDDETEKGNNQAEIIYNKLLEIDDNFTDSYLGLGIVKMRNQEYSLAVENFSKFIDLCADFPRSYYLRGLCYQELEQIDKAIIDFNQAIELDHHSLYFYKSLGECLLIQNEDEEAKKIYEEIKQKSPDYIQVYLGLSRYYLQVENLEECLANFCQALEISPVSAEPYSEIEKVLNKIKEKENEFQLTEKLINFIEIIRDKSYDAGTNNITKLCCELLINHNSKDIISFQRMINLMIRENKLEEAIKYAQEGIKLNPHSFELHTTLAYWLEMNNRLQEAREFINQALVINSENIVVNLLDAKIDNRLGNQEKAIVKLQKLVKLQPQSEGDQKNIQIACIELAEIYHKQKKYDEAFNLFIKGKKLIRQQYNQEALSSQKYLGYIEYLSNLQQPNFFKQWRDYHLIINKYQNKNYQAKIDKPQLVFLVGFSRSGTTLLGQILNSNSYIYTLDEKPGLTVVHSNIFSEISRLKGSKYLSDNNKWIETFNFLNNMNWQYINKLRKTYFQYMFDKIDFQTQDDRNFLLVDKNPFHFILVNNIYRLFPEAKFIFMVRHPFDVCLSSFMQNFSLNPVTAHFNTLENTAIFYQKAMILWLKSIEILPINVHTVFYEELVKDPTKVTQGICRFLELDWSEDLLNFHQHKKGHKKDIVLTPSYRQINQGIYREVKYRWHNYREQINSVRHILEPFAKLWNYEID